MTLKAPKGYSLFPEGEWSPTQVQAMYESGFAGAGIDEERTADLWNSVGWPDGDAAAHEFGLADTAAGKLVPAWVGVERLFPGCWPASAQTRGDCVSHSTRNGGLTCVVGDILSGKPDEVTGRVEGPPQDVSEEGKRDGIFSTESIYWWRDHGGDGWSCGHASSVLRTESGLWVRKPYPELGVDLSRYSGSLAGKYGRSNPPAEYLAEGAKHRIREVTKITSFEQIRDFLANGYGISTCGGEGWSNSRDENGVSRKQGSWAHALAIIGADDRDIIKQKYGGPLVLILNSWGRWNSGGRRVLGTDLLIPEGAYWALYKDAARRDMHGYSSMNGWMPRDIIWLPTPGFSDPSYQNAV